jgi:two-component system, OmpR family, response regulator
MGVMRALIVEDDTKLATLLRRGLTEEGYAADIVGTGADAICAAAATPYDVIILDVQLPDRDGFSVCRDMRGSEITAPVLMLTARGTVADRVAGLDAGADDYLVKPFSFAELTARLRALVRRGPLPRPAVLTVGQLRLDPATHEVWYADRRVELTAKEFALLHTFMRRPGQVLSRLDLLEHAWDDMYDNRSNIVDVYVGYLRGKLGRSTIETVRGAGYRLRLEALT